MSCESKKLQKEGNTEKRWSRITRAIGSIVATLLFLCSCSPDATGKIKSPTEFDPQEILATETASSAKYEYETYIVQDGDNLWNISKKVDLEAVQAQDNSEVFRLILEANLQIKDPSFIMIGDEIKIPKSCHTAEIRDEE